LSRINWGTAGPKLLGAGILIFSVVFWAFTGRVEALFVTTGGGLVGSGYVLDGLMQLRHPPPPPPPHPREPLGDAGTP
jgi:hypothetical protein